jgi:hypothetical protein
MTPEPNTPNDAGSKVLHRCIKTVRRRTQGETSSVSIALGFASALDTGYYDLVNEHRDVEFGKH